MTVFLPLEAATPLPHNPSFLVPSQNAPAQIAKAIQAILKAKRIVVICGAGISVQAGIPDFRSSDGLFKSLKRDNPRESLSSGKDLFDATVFNSEQTTSMFCQMMARLSDLSRTAEPTPFHQVLRSLDDSRKLLRVYTQNIDAIEEKCGLSFGVPEFETKRCKPRTKGTAPQSSEPASVPIGEPKSDSRLPSPTEETPRCIPLHGTLQTMHCQICNQTFPLQDHLHALAAGQPPQCPECTSLEETRQLVGKRPRGIGKLRPSVVLYNEAHKDGEGVGEVVRKDLVGASKGKGRSGADLLLVVGTSLRVPGTKRMVREFAKAVRSRGTASSKDECPSNPSSPGPSSRRTPSNEDELPMKAVYINLDFPVPTREWEGVFDAWVQGDAQQFAQMLEEGIAKETRAKELAAGKKRKREEESVLDMDMSPLSRRQKVSLPLTPPKSPPRLPKSSSADILPTGKRKKATASKRSSDLKVPESCEGRTRPTTPRRRVTDKAPLPTPSPTPRKSKPTARGKLPKTHSRDVSSTTKKAPKANRQQVRSESASDNDFNSDFLSHAFLGSGQLGT